LRFIKKDIERRRSILRLKAAIEQKGKLSKTKYSWESNLHGRSWEQASKRERRAIAKGDARALGVTRLD